MMSLKPETLEYIYQFCSTAEGRWAPIERLIDTATRIINLKPYVVVEIGVFAGRSLIPQALALKEVGKGRIYGIDPWKAEYAVEGEEGESAKWWGQDVDLEAMHQLTMKGIWKYQLDEQAVIIRSASQECCGLFQPASIDMLFIDGNHSEVASSRDVRNYFPLVKTGGLIMFDDANWPSTQEAVRLILSSSKVVDNKDAAFLIAQKTQELLGYGGS